MSKYRPLIGFGILFIVALFIMAAKPLSPELNDSGQMVLGGLLITIGLWIFKPRNIPFSIGGAFLAFWLLLQGLSPAVVFSGFTSSALWTLIPALYFGFVLQKTGLGKRMAMTIIKLSRPSYFSMVLAWTLIGIVLSMLTPSITVRVAIVIPIAVHCCELFELEKGSRGNSLILLTAFSMALIPGAGWLSGSLWGPIIQGMYSAVPGMETAITFDSWLQVALLPMTTIALFLMVGGYLALKPTQKLSKKAYDKLKHTPADPLSQNEKASAIILLVVFVLFVTSGIHGIPSAAVCLLALVFFFVLKVMEPSDVSTGISWDLVLFLGFALGLTAVFSATGISDWLASIVISALAPIAGNPFLFVIVVATILFAWRFVDIATFVPTIALLVPILPAISQAYSINPLVWIVIFVSAGNAMFMGYQNMWALMSQSISGERAWTPAHLARYGTVYFVASLAALVICVPLYTSLGFF